MITTVIILVATIVIVLSGLVTVQQGNVAVISMFGKYRRTLFPGLNFKIPILEQVFKVISIQNRSIELEFQAITQDQANVYFKSMLLYSVINQEEATIINVAYKFIDNQSLMQTIVRTVEGSIRSFVATKKQSEILSLRKVRGRSSTTRSVLSLMSRGCEFRSLRRTFSIHSMLLNWSSKS